MNREFFRPFVCSLDNDIFYWFVKPAGQRPAGQSANCRMKKNPYIKIKLTEQGGAIQAPPSLCAAVP